MPPHGALLSRIFLLVPLDDMAVEIRSEGCFLSLAGRGPGKLVCDLEMKEKWSLGSEGQHRL